MKRLFIAVDINLSQDFKSLISQLKIETYCDRIIWVNDDVRHLTLRFLGKTEESLIPEIEKVLSEVSSQTRSFVLQMDKLGAFGSKYAPDVLWLGFSQFDDFLNLFNCLEKRLIEIGFLANSGNFVPHVTLGRIKKIENKQRFWTSLNRLEPAFSQTVPIDALHLVQSKLTPQGPVYKVLNSFPLIS